jgi:hypothetical protein
MSHASSEPSSWTLSSLQVAARTISEPWSTTEEKLAAIQLLDDSGTAIGSAAFQQAMFMIGLSRPGVRVDDKPGAPIGGEVACAAARAFARSADPKALPLLQEIMLDLQTSKPIRHTAAYAFGASSSALVFQMYRCIGSIADHDIRLRALFSLRESLERLESSDVQPVQELLSDIARGIAIGAHSAGGTEYELCVQIVARFGGARVEADVLSMLSRTPDSTVSAFALDFCRRRRGPELLRHLAHLFASDGLPATLYDQIADILIDETAPEVRDIARSVLVNYPTRLRLLAYVSPGEVSRRAAHEAAARRLAR